MILEPIDRAYLDLADAIVVQACTDYRKALKGKSYTRKNTPEGVIKNIEKFFRSKWYRMLTKLDGEYLIEKLNQEHIENKKERLCKSN